MLKVSVTVAIDQPTRGHLEFQDQTQCGQPELSICHQRWAETRKVEKEEKLHCFLAP